LKDGKKLTVIANNLTDKNIYIKSVRLNGKPLNQTILTHNDLTGGVLIFEMSDHPNKKWAVDVSQFKLKK
jgi:putative alpha-1,2-mannosidase